MESIREQIIIESHDGELFLRKNGLFKKIKSKVSAVMKAAAKKIIEVTKTVIVKVKNAVHHVIQFVKDGVAYFIEEIVKLASQVADAITIIFIRIEVFFQDLMEFIGYILNWSDIKDASHYIGELYNEMRKTTNAFMLEQVSQLDTVVEKWGKDAHSNFGKKLRGRIVRF
ncbi:MAG: hypothetical protein ACERKZ_19130 [Lachnotalea sp.]